MLQALHHDRESGVRLRLQHQVNVIRHEAVSDHAHVSLGGMAVQQGKIESPIVVGAEDILLKVSALPNVLRKSGGCKSKSSSHANVVNRRWESSLESLSMFRRQGF